MEPLVIDRKILPEPTFSCIKSDKIRISKDNENVVLSPVKNDFNVNDMFGKYNKLSSEDFIKQKAVEKEFENWMSFFWMHVL